MGIQLFKKTHINFTGFRRKAYLISLFFFLTGMIWIFMNGGLRYGVDFAGGVIVQTEFAQPVQDEAVKASLAEVDMSGLTVQR
ncbi:MAG: protein translocase subunit SecF, partial [Mailhella sp.]|nr:protein translocase subunit SecF [Mailhella sp.]